MTRAITPPTLGQLAVGSRSVPRLLVISTVVECGRRPAREVRVVGVVKIAPYGTWTSPISPAGAAAAHTDPQWTQLHAGSVWWAESRPAEGGRLALLRETAGGEPVELLGPSWNVRNRVHEYGGRPFVVLDTPAGVRVAFTNWADQRVYLLDPDAGEPVPISPEPERPHGLRYSDLSAGPGGTHVWCVR